MYLHLDEWITVAQWVKMARHSKLSKTITNTTNKNREDKNVIITCYHNSNCIANAFGTTYHSPIYHILY